MLKVLIADRLPNITPQLQEAECEVVTDPDLKGPALLAALVEHDPDVLVVRSTKVGAEHVDAARGLSLIVRAGAGVNTIDLAAASGKGICVSNCPGMNAAAVAELAMGHLLNADRRIADNVADLRAGQWKKKTYAKSRGLKGRTLGVIGCGTIGRSVIRRARAFGMEVVAWSRSLTEAEASALGARKATSALDVAREADAITVHLAMTPATRHFIGPDLFAAMKPGAIFINTSRGGVVDQTALAEAVREKGLRAGLDVFQGEPSADGPWTAPLVDLPGVYGTHHIGASTAQAQEAVAAEALRVILGYKATGDAPNCVNIATQTGATHLLVIRHRDQVGVLAGVLGLLREAELNVERMENVIFSNPGATAGAACARIQVVGAPPEAVLALLRSKSAIFDVKVVSLQEERP